MDINDTHNAGEQTLADDSPEQAAKSSGMADQGNPFGYKTALILSAIAYCTDIENQLKLHAPNWSLVWSPTAEYGGNIAYVFSNGKQYMVAIRGSVLSFTWEAFQDWFEQDFDIFDQVAWQYPSSSANPQISAGAAKGLSDLQSLASSAGVGLLDFLMANAVANNLPITVTGHSLGGGLATVLAPWLHYQITTAGKTPPTLQVMTYAAPAIGNVPFAQAYDTLFENNSWRYYNSLDIVPKCAASIANISFLYDPHPQASEISVTYKGVTVTLQEAILLIAAGIEAREIYLNSFYQQTNQNSGSIELNTAQKLCGDPTADTIDLWFEQVGCQHDKGHYLQMLGAYAFTCTPSL